MELLLAPHGMEQILLDELKHKSVNVLNDWGRVKLIDDFPEELWFIQARAKGAQKFEFKSIKEAARILGSLHSWWGPFSITSHRRAQLIQAELRSPPQLFHPRKFGAPTGPSCGLWALVDANTLFAGVTSHSAALGEAKMHEDHINPPSRAYLKLWELFSFYLPPIAAQSVVCDLGACPGGWSWALAETWETKVKAVDRSPLDQRLKNHPRIQFVQGNAFSLTPESAPDAKWLLSDVICYPEKLLEFYQMWREKRPDINLVGTIKLQGETDFEVIKKFYQLQNAHVVHLFHNKHELTFYSVVS